MRLKGRPRLFFKPPAKDLGDQEGRAVHAYRNEHTIASTYQLTGRGYWSGRTVNVVCQPAKTGTGIRFQRVDLAEKPICPACTDHTDAIAYRTNLGLGEARFEMVEHLMAALRGLEIDNCLIQTDAPELPGLDGSAEAWTESLQAAGLVIQPASARRFRIEHPIRVTSGRGVLTAQPTDSDIGTFEYQLDYGDETTIRPQSFSVSLTPNRFVRHVSSARTFVTWSQAEQLRASGAASHVTPRDLLVIGENGPIDNEFRFRNECARHKTLDLIGDLALLGVDLIGKFSSVRGGHQLNAMMAAELQRQIATGQQTPEPLNHPSQFWPAQSRRAAS